jgi:hypothetical protein
VVVKIDSGPWEADEREFKIRVLRVMRPNLNKPPELVHVNANSALWQSLISLPVTRQAESGNARFISDDLIRHLSRTDIEIPQLFTTLEWMTGSGYSRRT